MIALPQRHSKFNFGDVEFKCDRLKADIFPACKLAFNVEKEKILNFCQVCQLHFGDCMILLERFIMSN